MLCWYQFFHLSHIFKILNNMEQLLRNKTWKQHTKYIAPCQFGFFGGNFVRSHTSKSIQKITEFSIHGMQKRDRACRAFCMNVHLLKFKTIVFNMTNHWHVGSNMFNKDPLLCISDEPRLKPALAHTTWSSSTWIIVNMNTLELEQRGDTAIWWPSPLAQIKKLAKKRVVESWKLDSPWFHGKVI